MEEIQKSNPHLLLRTFQILSFSFYMVYNDGKGVNFMNTKIISRYLQFLRKSRCYTQADLAKRLNVSRQAVSKWETGAAIPDLEILLRISKLYDLTINDILEPKILPQRINQFEQISTIPEKEIKETLNQFDTNSLVIALMGASPQINSFFEKILPDIDFETERNHIGRVRIESVEDIQNQIISMINLQAIADEA